MPGHDPRNGLTLCTTHHTAFEEYYFFIRFMPDVSILLYSSGPQVFIENRPLWDYEKDGFKRQKPLFEEGRPHKKQKVSDVQDATGASSRKLELNSSVFTDTLAATRAMPSWL